MNTITEGIEHLLQTREPGEEEYINEADGLIYCAKCHTPRQTRIELGGVLRTPRVICRCQKEAQERREAEQKHREFLAHVRQLKANGLQDRYLHEYTFANDLGYNPELQKAHDYVEHWEEMERRSMGLLLWGDVGTGKSFFAGCIANALLEQGIPVLMTNFPRILNTLTGMYSDDRNRFLDSLNEYSLLILDDLGIERNSEFALEQVFSVVDGRYRSRKPLIVTTNLTLNELKHPSDLAHSRIYDRILEGCVPLKINNLNIRRRNAEANLAQARELFTH